jgi:hypothetical protein
MGQPLTTSVASSNQLSSHGNLFLYTYLHSITSVQTHRVTHGQFTLDAHHIRLPSLGEHEVLVNTWVSLRNVYIAVLVDGDDTLAKVLLTLIPLEICQHMLDLVVPVFSPGNP